DTATSLDNLVFLSLDSTTGVDGRELAQRAQRAQEVSLANVLAFASERQRLYYLATLHPYSLLATMGDAPGIARALLHFKGVALDSVLEDRLLAHASRQPEDEETIVQLRLTKQRAMKLVLEGSRDPSPQGRAETTAERERLTTEVDRLEESLARRVAA